MCGCGTTVSGNQPTFQEVNSIGPQPMSEDSSSVLIEMHISCEKLINKSDSGKSNPYAVLFERDKETFKWTNISQTEVIEGNLNPKFVKSLVSKYFFEESQSMLIRIYDDDDEKETNVCIGMVEFMLHELVRAEDHTLKLTLKDGSKNAGTIIIQGEQITGKFSSNVVSLTIDGSNIKSVKKHFYKLFRSDGGSSFFLAYQSAIVRGYKWKPLKIPAANLFRDDEKRTIQLKIFEFSSQGNHKLLATTNFTFEDLKNNYQWDSPMGPINFTNVKLESRSSFLDYIFAGCQISLSIALDFTASNGYPRSIKSLHYFNPKTNPYINAIRSIGRILQEYDSDKLIPVYGFGAQPLEVSKVSHCFALNGNIFDPEVHTIDSVLEVYRKNILKLQFSGPTNFSEMIEYIGDFAEWNVTNGSLHNYFVLLIITDGQITDMNDTVDQIVRCSELPMSIIIVGVGERSFEDMSRLKEDCNNLYSKKYEKCPIRDIIQFVPFEKYADDPEKLSSETLEGLPEQLVDYMTLRQIPTKVPENQSLEDRKSVV